MAAFTKLVRFESDDGKTYFADLGNDAPELPAAGAKLTSYKSFEDLMSKKNEETTIFKKLLAPLPRDDIPIYCVGLNYKTHAAEANLPVSQNPPLWTKPAASLANPGQDIVMNKYCASSLPDYEAELVFVTSRECKNLTEAEASGAILGYTIGNDLSCRLFQLPNQGGGQFFYAKAFDDFAPIGPTLVSKESFSLSSEMTLRVNGGIRQTVKSFEEDMVFSPTKILSVISQGTTIPAYTAVMTGTPSGVGAFMNPKGFLNHEDVVTIEIPGIGELRNKIVFE
ncbi:fumarylacetoacetate hydrolase family protein [Xylariaceae sp. FL1019]|nr:fumarylacetoacetate hydrolase family protein [Xylariaceae sp. FL1019]